MSFLRVDSTRKWACKEFSYKQLTYVYVLLSRNLIIVFCNQHHQSCPLYNIHNSLLALEAVKMDFVCEMICNCTFVVVTSKKTIILNVKPCSWFFNQTLNIRRRLDVMLVVNQRQSCSDVTVGTSHVIPTISCSRSPIKFYIPSLFFTGPEKLCYNFLYKVLKFFLFLSSLFILCSEILEKGLFIRMTLRILGHLLQ